MAKVWMYNAAEDFWEPLSVPDHKHDQYLTQEEADQLYLNFAGASAFFAPKDHTHEGKYLKADDIFPGANIFFTKPAPGQGPGTIQINAVDTDTDEVGVRPGYPTEDPDPRELYVDTTGEGEFALFPPGGVGTGPGVGGVADHSQLTGLANDDHTQYHTDARGDARYLKSDGTSLIAATPTDPASVANKKYVDDAIEAKIIVSDNAASGIKPAGTVWIEY